MSGSTVVIGSATFGTLIASGLTWASANGLVKNQAEAVEAAAALTPKLTNQLVSNHVPNKRKLHLGTVVGFNALAPAISTGGQWRLFNIGGFPPPFRDTRPSAQVPCGAFCPAG